MKMGSVLYEKLKSLCCSNGWSFGVFWRFDQRNSELLTVEDAYSEEQMEPVVNHMLPQVHLLGEGIVGQSAFTGKHQWIFADFKNEGLYSDDYEIRYLFSLGIKTIALIFVESQGVVQFGSTQKILERPEFLDQTKRLLGDTEHISGPSSSAKTPSFNCEGYDLYDWFASFCIENIMPLKSVGSNELMEIDSFESMWFAQDETMSPFMDSLLQPNRLQTAGTEAQVMLCTNPSTQNMGATKTPCISTRSDEGSVLTSVESQLPSEMRTHDCSRVFSANAKPPACYWNAENFPWDSTASSFCNPQRLIDAEKSSQNNWRRSTTDNHSAPLNDKTVGEIPERETNLQTITEDFKPGDFTTDLSHAIPMDPLFELCSPLPEPSISGMTTTRNENLSQSLGVNSVYYGLQPDILQDRSCKQAANSMKSSIGDRYTCGRQKKLAIGDGAQCDVFDGLGLEFETGPSGDCWEDLMMPVVSCGHHLDKSTGVSECIANLDVDSIIVPQKGLYPELGLQKPLDVSSNTSCVTKRSADGHISNVKRRRMESSSASNNDVRSAGVFSPVGLKGQPGYDCDKINNLLSKKEAFSKSRVGLWIDDSYSVQTGSDVLAKSKKPEEPTKATRKRAKPGESTRPRPKDRQQIQDRIKELRGIIPDSAKCSIDSLLDRTIKHMLFLQSLTKYADKLKQTGEPKLIGQESKMALKDNSKRGGGATWAVEVGAQAMACPIIVEDLSPPGLMLIEMLCEDRGFFLEIVDVIQGFGLNILKGVMEIRENKIWAHFIAEATAPITRVDIFLSLLELLRHTGTGGMDSTKQPNCVINDKIPLLNDYPHTTLPCPISLAEKL